MTASFAGDAGRLACSASTPFNAFAFGGLFGDLDQNGVRDVLDVVILASAIVGNVTPGLAPFTAPRQLGDLNRDGVLDVLDLVTLQSFLVGNVLSLPT